MHEGRVGVAVVRIDHPPANALTYAMRLELIRTWERLRDDDGVRAIVLTGTGERFFSAGLDLEELRDDFRTRPDEMHDRIDRLRWEPQEVGLWKPVIAAISGYCLAGGWGLAQLCDVRIAGQGARFGIPEARYGLPAIFASTLPRFVSASFALEAALWADRTFTAERLHQVGWLNAVVADKCVLETALDWGEEVAALSPEAVSVHKQLVYATLQAGREQAEAIVRTLYDAGGFDETIDAFLSRGKAGIA